MTTNLPPPGCSICAINATCTRRRPSWAGSRPLRPEERPEMLLTPNGSILEMGAIYQAARHLGLPAVTYEFGEQRGRIWLAQNSEVMLQETDDLWADLPGLPADRKPVGTDPRPVRLPPEWQVVGEFLAPLAGSAQPGRRTSPPGVGIGYSPDRPAGSQRDRRQPDPGTADFQQKYDRMAGAKRPILCRPPGCPAGGAHPPR